MRIMKSFQLCLSLALTCHAIRRPQQSSLFQWPSEDPNKKAIEESQTLQVLGCLDGTCQWNLMSDRSNRYFLQLYSRSNGRHAMSDSLPFWTRMLHGRYALFHEFVGWPQMRKNREQVLMIRQGKDGANHGMLLPITYDDHGPVPTGIGTFRKCQVTNDWRGPILTCMADGVMSAITLPAMLRRDTEADIQNCFTWHIKRMRDMAKTWVTHRASGQEIIVEVGKDTATIRHVKDYQAYPYDTKRGILIAVISDSTPLCKCPHRLVP